MFGKLRGNLGVLFPVVLLGAAFGIGWVLAAML